MLSAKIIIERDTATIKQEKNMAKDIKFNIRLNIDGKNVIVQASENVKELQRYIMGTKQATTDERKSGGGPELAQRVEQGADGQRGRVYEGRHNAYTRAEQSSFNPLTRGATAYSIKV